MQATSSRLLIKKKRPFKPGNVPDPNGRRCPWLQPASAAKARSNPPRTGSSLSLSRAGRRGFVSSSSRDHASFIRSSAKQTLELFGMMFDTNG
jgi:hypothetical protein